MDEFGEQRSLPRMEIVLIPGECRCLMNRIGRRENWALLSLLALTAAIYVGSAGIPSLLDDADSFYAEVVREMALRHDWVTPYANGLRFFDKPPLFYWLIALSNTVLHAGNAFTARLPTALAVLALVFVTFKIGKLLWGFRVGLFSGLALATSAGMFLFTRIVLPDALVTLLLTLFLYCFLLWERAENKNPPLLWMYAFAALAVMAKGLIGLVFPSMILLGTLAATSRLREAARLLSLKGALLFVAIAVPWHVLIGARNHGFFWFYFINEHVLRFLNLRYPRDYNTVPRAWFWLFHLLWLFPWSVYFPAALRLNYRQPERVSRVRLMALCWSGFILVFFTFSTTQEYYSMPCYPALALLLGSAIAGQDPWLRYGTRAIAVVATLAAVAIAGILWMVRGLATPGDIAGALSQNPEVYTLSLGHMTDLTLRAFAYLRLPLAVAGVAFVLGAAAAWRPAGRKLVPLAALAAMMMLFFHAARLAMVVFDPYMSSRPLAEALLQAPPGKLIVDDQYYTFSSVFFYANRRALLLNGRVNNLAYGSYAPDAPTGVFIDDRDLAQRWPNAERYYLVVEGPQVPRIEKLVGKAALHTVASSGGKFLFTNK